MDINNETLTMKSRIRKQKSDDIANTIYDFQGLTLSAKNTCKNDYFL